MSTLIELRDLARSYNGRPAVRGISLAIPAGEARATLAGMSISEYLLREIERTLERPTREELLERLRSRQRVEPAESVAEAVVAEREDR